MMNLMLFPVDLPAGVRLTMLPEWRVPPWTKNTVLP